MAKFIWQARVFAGGPLFAASTATQVTVIDKSDDTLASLWSDRDGLSIKSNPFFITVAGKIEMYLDPGRYRVTAAKAGQTDTWEDVLIIDPDAGGGGSGNVPAGGTAGQVLAKASSADYDTAWVAPGGALSVLSADKPGGTLSSQKTEYATLGAGDTMEIVNIPAGSGYISSLFIAEQFITGAEVNAYAEGRLKIYYDGEVSPTIDVRMASFFQFQYATSGGRHANEYFGFNFAGGGNAGSWFCNLPIPYSNGIRIEITNGSVATTLRVWSVATIHAGVPNGWNRTRKLRAEDFFVSAAAPDSVQTFINASGLSRGRVVGCWMIADGVPGNVSFASAFLEGNIKIYLDGAASPHYESSGAEDYFLLGFYGANVPPYNWAGQAGMTFRNGNLTTSFYRLHIRDPIEFESGLRVTWNCGDTSQVSYTGNTRAWACTYYYTE